MEINLPASILVIDDEADNFDVIETFLNGEEYQLNYAPSAKDALSLLETFQPDAILLDLMMPNMSGIEFCKVFKADAKWQHIPIIMVTSLTSKEDLGRCLAAGADDFLGKPLNSIELRARLHAMLRLKQQYDNVQALLRLREDMVNMIVHDLRNPIASILLAAEVLRHPALPPEKQKKKIEQIIVGSQDLRVLVDDLLLMAKLESGKLTLNRSQVDLQHLCEAAIAGLQEIAAQKNIHLSFKLPEINLHPVHGDPVLLRRIIDNLLSNAIKFSPQDGQVTLLLEQKDASTRIQVSDLGPGVSEDLRQSIFEKYEIGTLIKGTSQTGLGLAFCKIVTEAHGGNITVQDNHPRGSVFTIEFESELF